MATNPKNKSEQPHYIGVPFNGAEIRQIDELRQTRGRAEKRYISRGKLVHDLVMAHFARR